MSGNPRPKGREFNPSSTLAGSQTLRLVNGVFVGTVVVSLGLTYWFLKYRAENSRFFKWINEVDLFRDTESKVTQARIYKIREAKRRSEDPYPSAADSTKAAVVEPVAKELLQKPTTK